MAQPHHAVDVNTHEVIGAEVSLVNVGDSEALPLETSVLFGFSPQLIAATLVADCVSFHDMI